MKPEQIGDATLYLGDVLDGLAELEDRSVQTCITSPPYWGLRDYGVEGQLGLEPTFQEYVDKMVTVFEEVRRVLRDDGTLWLNMGDCYTTGEGTVRDRGPMTSERDARGRGTPSRADGSGGHSYAGPAVQPNRTPQQGLKPKDLVGMPWRIAFALQEHGWYLRSDIIWSKPSPMPESVKDRPTRSHEYIFLMSKSARYYYDAEVIKEPVSPDTQARYARGRSDSHKYADGGPGNQTIAKSFEHMRQPGVNPNFKFPGGWGDGPGVSHNAIDHARASKDAGRAAQELKTSTKFGHGAGWRNKQNESFSGAVNELVDVRNKRTVWNVASEPFPEAHFATFPTKLIEPCVLAGAEAGAVVLDPFAGSGTTGVVALAQGRKFTGIELNPDYMGMIRQRLTHQQKRLFA